MDKVTLDKAALNKRLPPPLPDTIGNWERITKNKRTLNDFIEDVHRALIIDKNEQYERLLWAVYDEQAVEGGLSDDNTFAASMIRDKAKKMGVAEVATAKAATIRKALNIVLRRYGQSRKQRRNMVGGQYVPEEPKEQIASSLD